MKCLIAKFIFGFQMFFVLSCTQSSVENYEKSKNINNKDESLSIYHEMSKNKSKIYVYVTQKKKRYCLQGDKIIRYGVTDDYSQVYNGKRNYALIESNEPEDFLLDFQKNTMKKGISLSDNQYYTRLKRKDILTIDLDSYYLERKYGWKDPVYVSMTFFDCSNINDIYDPDNIPSILPIQYLIRLDK